MSAWLHGRRNEGKEFEIEKRCGGGVCDQHALEKISDVETGLEPDPLPADGLLVCSPGGVEPGLFPGQLFLKVKADEQYQIFKTAVVGFACGRYRICVVAGT